MSDQPPFDEAAYLARLDALEREVEAGARIPEAAFINHFHGTRRLLTELIATRQRHREAAARCAAFEQGQTLLPLSPHTDTNLHPSQPC